MTWHSPNGSGRTTRNGPSTTVDAMGRFRLAPGPFSHHPEIRQVIPHDHCPQLFDSGSGLPENSIRSVDDRRPTVVLFDLRSRVIADTEAAGLIESLNKVGTHIWVWTNHPPEPLLSSVLMAASPQTAKATVFIACMDARVQAALDPLGSSPQDRLAAVEAFRHANIPVDVAIEPLLPGVTDTNEGLKPLLQAVARLGVTQVSVGYLTLPDSERGRVEEALHELGVLDSVMDAFVEGPVVRERGEYVRLLPKPHRHRGYASAMALAAELGMTLKISSTSNPDFRRTPVEAADRIRSLQEAFRSRVRSRVPKSHA
ncbi:MAG: hypothetical protein N2039_11990 [Gemmataceae bacterium]|nr:hypothetical protein [Gemmataceae bacterium]